MTLELLALRFRFVARKPIHFAAGAPANLLRGALGARLYEHQPDYRAIFAPALPGGPSGLKDPPRPFVFRARNLDGRTVAPGEAFEFGVNLFAPVFADRLVKAISGLNNATLEGVERAPISASLDPAPARAVTVEFLTPTELKPATQPDFPVLLARLRDRIATLRSLYGPGPLAIDFRAMAERAAQIRMTRCEIRRVEAKRKSHPLSGFVGSADYEGDLAEFVPYLKAGAWTGVGRQTVWGKGEIQLRY